MLTLAVEWSEGCSPVEDLPFESLVRQYARHDSRITLTTLDRLMSELKSVDAIVCTAGRNKHRVRVVSGNDYKLCFKTSVVFTMYITVSSQQEQQEQQEQVAESASQAGPTVPVYENTLLVRQEQQEHTISVESSSAAKSSSADISTMTRSQLLRIVRDDTQPKEVQGAASTRLMEMDNQKKPIKTPKVVKRKKVNQRKGAN